jgi:hypothetical protein
VIAALGVSTKAHDVGCLCLALAISAAVLAAGPGVTVTTGMRAFLGLHDMYPPEGLTWETAACFQVWQD